MIKKNYFTHKNVFPQEIYSPNSIIYLQRNENRKRTECKILTNFGDTLLLIEKSAQRNERLLKLSEIGYYKTFTVYTKDFRDVTRHSSTTAQWNSKQLTPGTEINIQYSKDKFKDSNKTRTYRCVVSTCTLEMLTVKPIGQRKIFHIKPNQAFEQTSVRIID